MTLNGVISIIRIYFILTCPLYYLTLKAHSNPFFFGIKNSLNNKKHRGRSRNRNEEHPLVVHCPSDSGCGGLLPVPGTARVELKNEISGLPVRKAKLAARCWSNEDDLGWAVLKPGEARSWRFTTMNMWPFEKTEFRCQFRSGLGTTREDLVTIFSVGDGFRKECKAAGSAGDECIWVAKRDGFYQRRIIKDGIGFRYVVDVLRSKWVWKW